MYMFRDAPTCEKPRPEPMPERRYGRSGSRRKLSSKRRSPAPTYRERASDSAFRPREFDLDELERRDEDKRHKYALLKPEPMMRERARSTGDSYRPFRARNDDVQNGPDRLRTGNASQAPGLESRRSADTARPRLSDISRGPPSPDLFEPMFVRVEELEIDDQERPAQHTPLPAEQEGPNPAVHGSHALEGLCSASVRKLVQASLLCTVRSASQTPNGQKAWEEMAETLSDHAFKLQVWASEASIAQIGGILQREESVRTADIALRRLSLRTSRVLGLISEGSPRLFPLADPVQLATVEGEQSSDEDDQSKLPGPHLTPSQQILQELKGLGVQIRTLRRLTRAVSDLQQHEEMATLAAHVQEIQDLFGSEAAIQKHGVGDGLPTDVALKQAREQASLAVPSTIVSRC